MSLRKFVVVEQPAVEERQSRQANPGTRAFEVGRRGKREEYALQKIGVIGELVRDDAMGLKLVQQVIAFLIQPAAILDEIEKKQSLQEQLRAAVCLG